MGARTVLRFGAAYPGGVYWVRAHGSQEADRPATFEEVVAETIARPAPSGREVGGHVTVRRGERIHR